MKYAARREAHQRVLALVELNLYRLEKGGYGKIEILVSRRNAKVVSYTLMAAPMLRFDAPTADDPAGEDFLTLSEEVEVQEDGENVE